MVVFSEDLRVERAVRIPREVVNERFPRNGHVNGRIIRLSASLLADPRVRTFSLSDAWLSR